MQISAFVTLANQIPLWRRQLFVVMRLETGRNLLSSRGLWAFFLAFAPALIAGLHATFAGFRPGGCSVERDTDLLAWFFLVFYLRLALYFGTLGLFVRLFRGEMVQKTMHYYLIAPIRREVLVLGKFLTGSLGSAAIFATGGASCIILMYSHHGQPGVAYLVDGSGGRQLVNYLGLILLACLGYGSVFLALGLLFKNPVLPAVMFFGWESISGMLPLALQLLSVTFYLKALFPVQLPVVGLSGLFTVATEPVHGWLAVTGLLMFSLVVVTLSALGFRRIELDELD